MGSGLGWIDYDNDGWPDLFCVQDGPVRPSQRPGPPPTNKLYRNNRDGTFTDVTEKVGLARAGFGMGCAVGDFDNDGFDDLRGHLPGRAWSCTTTSPTAQGGRRFVDVTAGAGLHDPHWATSCAWGDVDGDGLLDLYVCNYVEVDLDITRRASDRDVEAAHHLPADALPARPRTGCSATTATARSPTSAPRPASPRPRRRRAWGW